MGHAYRRCLQGFPIFGMCTGGIFTGSTGWIGLGFAPPVLGAPGDGLFEGAAELWRTGAGPLPSGDSCSDCEVTLPGACEGEVGEEAP